MRYSTQIKPISYVKAHAAELLDRITREREPIIITQNGEARAVLVDVRSYEEGQERMAMLQVMGGGADSVASEPISVTDMYSEISGRKPVQSVPAPTPIKKLNQL
jgi:prevent-host-death family protein